MERKPKKQPLMIRRTALLFWLGMLLIGAVSCQAENAQPTAEQDLEETPLVETAEPTATEESSDVAVLEEVEAEPEDQCLICHTDQATLMDTADPVVAIESESSGEG